MTTCAKCGLDILTAACFRNTEACALRAELNKVKEERDNLLIQVEVAERLATAACKHEDLHHLINEFDSTAAGIDDDQRAALRALSNELSETTTMIFLEDKSGSFHCICGANVFRKFVHNSRRFKCNACEETYTDKSSEV